MEPHARQQSTQQSTYIICDGATLLKLEKILIITINLTIIARHVDDDVQRRRIDDETMGAAWRPPPPRLIIRQSTNMLWERVCIIKNRRKYYVLLLILIFMHARCWGRSRMQHATSITSPSRHPLLATLPLLHPSRLHVPCDEAILASIASPLVRGS